VYGALALADGRLLSRSWDKTLRLWTAQGEPLSVLRGHENGVSGALALADGRLLSWSTDNTLRLWTAQGDAVGVLFLDATVTAIETTRTGIFVGDALGGVHWVCVNPSATQKQS
jgi:WD40 repeat protein